VKEMIEDELLKWKFKHGSIDALQRIYEKYLNSLLTLAMALLNEVGDAEDVVHDAFVSLAQSADKFRMQGSLRSYLATCVVNRARDRIRAGRRQPSRLDDLDMAGPDSNEPERLLIFSEQALRLSGAVARLPDEQREAVVLHLKAGMKFREIAKLQGVSVNTVQGRYRYGLNTLRSILNGEVEK